MDMQLLSRMVGELVLEHDCVGLPGVGTFVAEVMPATFSDKGYTINPPYRRLSFYSDVREEDLMVDFYAAENSMDKPAARAYMTAFLAELKDVLKERKTVTFPGLGRLRATRQNNFFFVPNEDLDIFPDGFGLDPVSLKTHMETEEEVSIAVSDLASIMEAARQKPVEEPAAQAPVPAEENPIPADPVPEAKPVQETSGQVAEPHRSRWWIWPVAIIGAAAVLLAAFLILAHVAPDFIDSILYTEEELRIINA